MPEIASRGSRREWPERTYCCALDKPVRAPTKADPQEAIAADPSVNEAVRIVYAASSSQLASSFSCLS
ncbi:MAG: hypothetical protein ABI857_10135 [Acidobacteriota bacterium]